MIAFLHGIQIIIMSMLVFVCSEHMTTYIQRLDRTLFKRTPDRQKFMWFLAVIMAIYPTVILAAIYTVYITNQNFTHHLELDVGTSILLFTAILLGIMYTQMPKEKQSMLPKWLHVWMIH